MAVKAWILAVAETGGVPAHHLCARCGATEEMDLPMRVTDYVKWAESFEARHADCKEAE